MVCLDFIPPYHFKFLTNLLSEKLLPKLNPKLEVPVVSKQSLPTSFSQLWYSESSFTAIYKITTRSLLLCSTKEYDSFVEALLQSTAPLNSKELQVLIVPLQWILEL